MAYDARRYLLRVVDGSVGATVFDKSVNQFIAERFGVGAVLFTAVGVKKGKINRRNGVFRQVVMGGVLTGNPPASRCPGAAVRWRPDGSIAPKSLWQAHERPRSVSPSISRRCVRYARSGSAHVSLPNHLDRRDSCFAKVKIGSPVRHFSLVTHRFLSRFLQVAWRHKQYHEGYEGRRVVALTVGPKRMRNSSSLNERRRNR